VKILSGRFGPYVKHGQVNANIPRGSDPAELTLEAAVELLAARAAKAPAAKGKVRKAPATKATAAKTPAAKKPAARKPAARKTAKPGAKS
jgi:DNA topoisomerase-1